MLWTGKRGKMMAKAPLLVGVLMFITLGRQLSADPQPKENRFLDMPLDSLLDIEVRSPSRKTEKYRETASSIYVVDRQQIINMGARNLKDIMRLVPGVQQVNNSDEQLLSIRGIFADNGSKLLIMIDGHEVNRVQDQGSSAEVPNMFADKIERIEVVRGPGGVIYGASAFSGIINIITRDPGTNDENHARVSIGSFNQYKTEAMLDQEIAEDVHAFLYAGLATSNGDHVPISGDEFTSNSPSRTNIEGLKSPSFEMYSRIRTKDVEFKARYFDQNEEIPSKTGFNKHYQSGFLEVVSNGIALTDTIIFRPRVYFDAIEQQRDNVYKGGEFRFGTELRVTHEAADGSQSTIAGLELKQDHFGRLPYSGKASTDSYAGNTTSIPSMLSNDVTLNSIGLYMQHDHFLSDTLKVTGGARYDRRSLAQYYITPRLVIVWMPKEERTLKLLYQSATLPLQIENRGPSAIKDFSPNVANEKVKSYEAIWSEKTILGLFETSVFLNQIRDLIVIRLNDTSKSPPYGLSDYPLFNFDNSVDANILGSEIVYRYEVGDIFGSLSHSVLIDSDVKDRNLNVILVTTNGDNINGYSDNISKFDINYNITPSVNFNTNLVLDWGKPGVLRRNGSLDSAINIPASDRRLGDWNVAHTGKRYFLNLTLGVKDILIPKLDLFLTGYNVLDEKSPEYNNSGYLEQGSIGRSVFASILKRF